MHHSATSPIQWQMCINFQFVIITIARVRGYRKGKNPNPNLFFPLVTEWHFCFKITRNWGRFVAFWRGRWVRPRKKWTNASSSCCSCWPCVCWWWPIRCYFLDPLHNPTMQVSYCGQNAQSELWLIFSCWNIFAEKSDDVKLLEQQIKALREGRTNGFHNVALICPLRVWLSVGLSNMSPTGRRNFLAWNVSTPAMV